MTIIETAKLKRPQPNRPISLDYPRPHPLNHKDQAALDWTAAVELAGADSAAQKIKLH